ncbi:hypothetical protein [Methylomonas sp. AM2-LC]|uniref:hypothetical protein n=1 Tax=Methylomonas sp. AM2-LC TaxID=3153301 RepID=UPI00326315CD
MIEVLMVFVMVAFVAICVFWPQSGSASLLAKNDQPVDRTVSISEADLSADSMFENQYLTHLQQEIEVTLFPRPTDSVLKRHYDNLVATKLKEHLSQMPM